MLIAFLQQILTYGGFYDNLEWVGLEAVQIVGSMSASGGGTGLGRHQLSTRFTSVLRVVSITQPDKVSNRSFGTLIEIYQGNGITRFPVIFFTTILYVSIGISGRSL